MHVRKYICIFCFINHRQVPDTYDRKLSIKFYKVHKTHKTKDKKKKQKNFPFSFINQCQVQEIHNTRDKKTLHPTLLVSLSVFTISLMKFYLKL